MVATLTSVEEYLKTTYEPDAEYVDGVIEERNTGDDAHSAWQVAVGVYFSSRARDWNIRVRPVLRMKASECRYRIPDVAILDANAPRDPVALVPPLIAFEILSPEDRLSRLLIRLADFETMGVPALYAVDPADNSFFRFREGKLQAATEIVLGDRTISFREILDLLW